MTGTDELLALPDRPLTRQERRAEFWFQLGFWCIVVSLVPDVAMSFVDLQVIRALTYLGHFGPPFLAYSAWLTFVGTPPRAPFLTPAYRAWLVFFILWCAVLTARYFFLERSFRFLLMIDLYPAVAFIAGVVVGGKLVHEPLWDRLYMRMLIPGIPLLLTGLSGIQTAVREEAVASEAYGMEVLVEPVLFLLLTLDGRSRTRDKYLIVLALVAYVLSQVLFQKRAPTARIAVFVLAFAVLCPLVSRRTVLAKAILLRYAFGVGAAVLFVLMATIGPGRFGESTQALERRFEQSAEDKYRQSEVELIWKRMTPRERIIGKGFGGYFIGLGLSTSLDYVPGVGTDVHAANHIGAFWAIFKGGMILFVILNLAYLGIVLGVLRALSHPRLFACWFYIIGHLVFQGIETLWGKGHMIHVLLVGLCVGHFVAFRGSATREAATATGVSGTTGGEPVTAQA